MLDLIENWGRTALVVFSIAVGVFSVGVIAGAYVIISNDMSASYAANRPANLELRMSDDFDENVLDAARNTHGIGEADGQRVFNVRVRPKGSTQWLAIDIHAVDDFKDKKLNLLNPVAGKTFPAKREVVLERDVLDDLDIGVGDDLEFQLPDGTVKSLPVVGIVQDPTTGADDFLAPSMAYITMNTLPYLEQEQAFNRIYASVKQESDDMPHIRAVGADLKDKLEKSDYTVGRMRFAKTHEHPMAPTVNAILGILLALGVLVVFLSSSLIANTLSALLNQHLRHIGVMKLVGARNRQVFAMYLVLILSFGALALLIAVPLGGQGAYALSEFIADKLGFLLLGYRIVPLAFAIQIAIGILVPLLAGFVPVINGSRITVLNAISGESARETESDTSSGSTRKESRWERFETGTTHALARRGVHIPRPLLISLRNTFRRRGRLLLTLFTLTMGGAIFIAVFNVRVTLHDYMGTIGDYFLADITLDFDQPYRIHEIEQYAFQVPGVKAIEGWQFVGADILDDRDNVLENINILAPPDSKMIQPLIVEGRWIEPGDRRKLTVCEAVLSVLPGLHAGDTIHLKIEGKEEDWEVVGIFKFVGREGILAYAPFDYVAEINHLPNRSYSYRLVTERHDRPYQDAKSEELDLFFQEKGFNVRQARPGLSTLDTAVESLDILVTFLLIMALLTATVGSMGLTGTMGMNVLERTREIGIMRAIGADDKAIMRTVIAEGVVIGGISFVLAVILSVPFTYGLSMIVSMAVFETPIKVVFTFTGYLIWLALVLVLSAVASVMPARNAARLTIREVLAYE
jgi:putative ABC transport system permease protein